MRSRLNVWVAAGLLGLAGVTGCGSSPTGPGIQPQVTNSPDNFQYQTTSIVNYTSTLSYTWQNSGTVANVNQATTVTGGTATLVILDANGVQVYSRSLADNGTFATASGVAGAWTIRVVYSNTSATVNFRVQKG
jgi:hypothetical protein